MKSLKIVLLFDVSIKLDRSEYANYWNTPDWKIERDVKQSLTRLCLRQFYETFSGKKCDQQCRVSRMSFENLRQETKQIENFQSGNLLKVRQRNAIWRWCPKQSTTNFESRSSNLKFHSSRSECTQFGNLGKECIFDWLLKRSLIINSLTELESHRQEPM